MDVSALQLALAGLIGLIAGIFGGLAGIGGSMIMLPGLAWVFGYPDGRASLHHVYMAAAMSVNVAVAVPSAIRHHKAGAVRVDLLRVILPSTVVAIIGGVLLSNRVDGAQLRLMLAGFIVFYCVTQLIALFRRHDKEDGQAAKDPERAMPLRLVLAGALVGLVAGLLGIGGGVLMVPILQVACGVKLRHAIATSSAAICLSAAFGASLKLWTLSGHGESAGTALALALAMAPTAVLGAWIGAALTHSLPLRAVRVAIIVLLVVAASRLAGLWGGPASTADRPALAPESAPMSPGGDAPAG